MNAIVESLGWTLIHFLWQGLIIGAVYASARQVVSRPNARYLLACAALLAMMTAPLATWIAMRPSAGLPDPAYRVRNTPPAVGASPVTTVLPLAVRATVESPGLMPAVVVIWLAGAVAFWLRLAGGWVMASRLRSRLVRPAPAEWQSRLRELRARIGVSRPVRLLVSGLVQVPTVAGWLRPVVLVPVGALSGLPVEHLEAVLLHELAHIRRHDYLVNVLQSACEALLFYHPAVWWVSGHIRAERELCCDDVAVAASGDAFTYARALVEWESCRPSHVPVAVAANGRSLTARMARILGQPQAASRSGAAVVASAALLFGAAYGVFAQTADRPAFQAASIKPNTAANPWGMMLRPQPGGRLVSENAPLLMLIQNAYAVQAFQVVGGPAWMNTVGYDLDAKPEGATDRKQMWLMLQTLLADRFKLALHREKRELPVYALTVGKGGLKRTPPKESGCVEMPPDGSPPPGSLLCGRAVIRMSPEGLKMEGSKVPMAELTRMLSALMGRPVLDQSGVTELVEVHLSFTPDQSTAGLPGAGGPRAPGGPRPPVDPEKPTIFAAVQEQLGLKLGTAKGPVEVLVIDHVEKPTEN
ncbi:MAG: peptidase BlaR1 [Candidatus Solibacter sp.]|nr:peptidase BlaR1 [Candidatus Solibacter sp.]